MSQTKESPAWRDARRSRSERVDALVGAMTLEEKVSQLVGLWVGADASGGDVAPHQGDMTQHGPAFSDVIEGGLGQLTRPFGTAPVDPALGARSLARAQRSIMAANRFGIPALVHEECLAGFAAWGATAYPVPLSWAASFDPALVEEMSHLIGVSMRSVGIHQGLAPVLDVVRDHRWGRVEETMGEDPYLVGTVGAAYVRGLESAGVVATLKHFAGYSGSRAGRNHAPVDVGPRQFADVFLPPFEMALRAGAQSVMNSYAEIDGTPAGASSWLLTDLLRGEWGFTGTVVADYFAISFLHTMQCVAADTGEAAVLALRAGIDVELPSVFCYGAPLVEAVRSGDVDEALVDRALTRVLAQKLDLGLLDEGWAPAEPEAPVLDDARSQAVALQLAREAVILLANGAGALPLAEAAHVAVIGPLADDPYAMLGCYSFPAHVGVHHPQAGLGIDIPTVLAGLRAAHPGQVSHARGCDVMAPGRDGFAAAVATAAAADIVVVAVGDRAGLFGRGTSGEGCDAPDLRLPGEQGALVDAILASGTPVVLLVLSGRPYALGAWADRAAALVQAFFPGQLGGQALAEVLTGAVNPSGHLPVGIPSHPGAQPATYLAPPLGQRTKVSDIDPTPLFPFGHGRSYAELNWGDLIAPASDEWPTDGAVTVGVALANNTDSEVADVVQLYLHDPVAQVTRPVLRLIGHHRVTLAPGRKTTVLFDVHADLTSFIGRDLLRVVEPGAIELHIARSSGDVHGVVPLRLVGAERHPGPDRLLTCKAREAARPGGGEAE